MKRKIIYLMVGAGIVAAIAGNRFYQKCLAGSGGYLGDEVIIYTGSADPDGGDGGSGDETGESGQASVKNTSVETSGTPSGTGTPDARQQTSDPSVSVSPVPVSKPAKKSYGRITSHGEIRVYDTGTAVLDDAAYELYTYVDSTAERYADAVNRLTKKLDSGVAVYGMVVPTSVGITFPDNKIKKINSSFQEEALDNIEKKLSGREIYVSLYDILMRHRKEYIYFKTDHHWTSLGAYYAYRAFCEAKGIVPNELSVYKKISSEGFLGSFYRETDHDKALKADTLEALLPVSKNLSMEYTTTGGNTITAPVIANADKYSASLKYCAYIAGDNPYTVIRNKDKKDGSSCVVVKESYGNAFVPFLADHYQTIYVIDYRYWEGKLCDFIQKRKLQEVIVINNISMTRNSYLIGKLLQIIA